MPDEDYRLTVREITFPKPGEMEIARRSGKKIERQKPRRVTTTFSFPKEEKEVEVNIVFPEKG